MEPKGKLKIYFGYSAGVGKTYTMLQEAQQLHVEGIDIVVGYIEPHGRKDTEDLIYGIEQLPLKEIIYKEKKLYELNIEAILDRKPNIVLVDELAHTNAPGCRHNKRYYDVLELLHAGIDVYSTLNVQHIESLQDLVEDITHIKVNERIPDILFDQADDIKLIDIEPDLLLERLKEGKVYAKVRIQQALDNFFNIDNLNSLRSIALRRCAQRMDYVMAMKYHTHTKEHILVCISSSLTNAKVIRNAARMAQAFQADFTALYIDNKDEQMPSKKDQHQLHENVKLAKNLNANIVTTYGNDIAFQISQYAKTSHVTKLVIGRSLQKYSIFKKKTLVDKLTLYAPNLDIYIIPDARSELQSVHNHPQQLLYFSKQEGLYTCCISFISTIVCLGIYQFLPNVTNIILLFVLSSCIVGYFTGSPLYCILSALYYIVILNFFFIEPRFTFEIYSYSQYVLIFVSMLFVSLSLSSIMNKLKKEQLLASYHLKNMELLLSASQNLQTCKTQEDVIHETINQVYAMFKRPIIYYPVTHTKKLGKPIDYIPTFDLEIKKELYSSTETAVVQWVLKNNKSAGASTSTLPTAKALYLSIRHQEKIFGIIGITMQSKEDLSPNEKNLLITLLNEVALTFDSLT